MRFQSITYYIKRILILFRFVVTYTLIHGEPLQKEIVTTLEKKELKAIITQLATFLVALHNIPVKQVTTLGFPIEKQLPTGKSYKQN